MHMRRCPLKRFSRIWICKIVRIQLKNLINKNNSKTLLYQPPVVYMVACTLYTSHCMLILITLNPFTFPDYGIHCSSHIHSFGWFFHIKRRRRRRRCFAVERRTCSQDSSWIMSLNTIMIILSLQLMNMNESQRTMISKILCFLSFLSEWMKYKYRRPNTDAPYPIRLLLLFLFCISGLRWIHKVKDYIYFT